MQRTPTPSARHCPYCSRKAATTPPAAVRRLGGRDRYSSRAAYRLLQRLHELVRGQVNFFRPLRKLLAGQRVGSKRVRRYPAQTPYQRLR